MNANKLIKKLRETVKRQEIIINRINENNKGLTIDDHLKHIIEVAEHYRKEIGTLHTGRFFGDTTEIYIEEIRLTLEEINKLR